MSATPIPPKPRRILTENGGSLRFTHPSAPALPDAPRKRGRPKKVRPVEPMPPKGKGLDALFSQPGKLTAEDRITAARIVDHLTAKWGRLPTKTELADWAAKLRAGAGALDAYVAAGFLETPPAPPDMPPMEEDLGEAEGSDDAPAPRKVGRPKKGSRGPRAVDESKVVCEGCQTLGHSIERCLERA